MKKGAGTPPDYMGAANAMGQAGQQNWGQQFYANRPNQSGPFSFSSWNLDPKTGQASQSYGLDGPLAGAAQNLSSQFASANANPIDYSSMPQVSSGEDARKAATDATYQRETTLMDPQWAQKEEQTKAMLYGQGATEGSPAWNRAMQELSNQKNSAYQTAREGSIELGGTEQQRQQQMSLMARQQAISEALQSRTLPFQEMQGLQGLSGQPSFTPQGMAPIPPYLQAMLGQGNFQLGAGELNGQTWGDIGQGVGSILGIAAALSDERTKKDVQRLPVEADDHIPFALFRYKGEPRHTPRRLGVIAQDVERAGRHDAVIRDDRGMRRVHYNKIRAFSLGA